MSRDDPVQLNRESLSRLCDEIVNVERGGSSKLSFYFFLESGNERRLCEDTRIKEQKKKI